MSKHIKIPLSLPSLGIEEELAVKRVLNSAWLTTGKEAIALENEFFDYLNIPTLRVLAVQSCTAALHLAYKSLEVDSNTRIISSTINFISSISPALYCGAEIEFVDCAPNSLYPSINELEKIKMGKHKKILNILPLGGYHPYYSEYFEFAKERDFVCIEDAAHTFPANGRCGTQVQPYGTYADIGVYSFYANKTITTGEGGLIISKNEEVIKKATLLRNLGMNKITWERFQNKPEQFAYDIVELGYKYNMPDILAAIGREQLKKAQYFLEKRSEIAKYYLQRLAMRDYWGLPEYEHNERVHSWHLFILRIEHPKLSRDDFMQKLAELSIGTSVHYIPLHLMTYFKKRYSLQASDYPNSYAISQKILSIPIYPGLSLEDAEYVCDSLIKIGDGEI